MTVDQIADYFVGYLFTKYKGTRHVRRVAAWIGFLLKGIERLGATPDVNRQRQVIFASGGRRFKVRYNHRAGARGGLELVEVLPGRGMPDGPVLLQIENLRDAERAYRSGLRRAIARSERSARTSS